MSDDLGMRKIGRRRRTTRRLTRRPLRVPGDDVPRSFAPQSELGEEIDSELDGQEDEGEVADGTHDEGHEEHEGHDAQVGHEDRRSADMIEVDVEGEGLADGPASGVMQAPERHAELLPPPSADSLARQGAELLEAAVSRQPSEPPDEKTNPKIRLSDPAQRPSSLRPPMAPPPPAIGSEPPDAPTRPRIELSHEMAMMAGRVTTLEMPPVPSEETDADTNPRIRVISDAPASTDHAPASTVIVTRARVISDRPSNAGAAPVAASIAFEETREPATQPTLTGVAVEMPAEVDEIEAIDIDDDGSDGASARRSKAPPPPPAEVSLKPPPPKKAAPPPPTASLPQKPPPPPPTGAKKAASPKVPTGPKRRQWWEDFFSDDYLHSVLPPTAAQIKRQVDFVEQSLGLVKGAAVLDVGCGTGAYALELARRGYLVVALDLSLPMITRAAEEAQQEGLRINFLHTDLREIAFESMFDAIICVGTTFGFFDDDSNRDVVQRLRHALKPHGRLFLDVVNRDHVVQSQPNLVWFEGEGCVVMEESDFNYFTSRLTVKRTMMREDGRQSDTEYSLRLYSLHELGQLLQQAGFRVNEVSGQEATRGVFYGTNSTRIILLAERRLPKDTRDKVPAPTAEHELPRLDAGHSSGRDSGNNDGHKPH
jgi:SAM-dependent methyltransferase